MCISDISCSVKKQKESNFLRPVNERDDQLFCMKVMKNVDWITFVVPNSLPPPPPPPPFFLNFFFLSLSLCFVVAVVVIGLLLLLFVCLFCFILLYAFAPS